LQVVLVGTEDQLSPFDIKDIITEVIG